MEEIALQTWVSQSLFELRAKLVQQASHLASCEDALARSTLACWRNWILGKKAGLFCQTALAFQGLVAYAFCWLQCIKVKPCSQQISEVKKQSQATLCSQRYRQNLPQRSHWCKHTMVS